MGVGRPLAENGLSRVLVEIASSAVARFSGEQLQCCARIIDALFGKQWKLRIRPSRRHFATSSIEPERLAGRSLTGLVS
jgi:hypothetical protein